MTLNDEITPTYYSVGDGRLEITGKTVDTMVIRLQIMIHNANEKIMESRYIELSFTDAEKQSIIDKVSSKLSDVETETGLTRLT